MPSGTLPSRSLEIHADPARWHAVFIVLPCAPVRRTALPDDLTENDMIRAKPPREWVVYQTPPIGKAGPGTVVAERAEWERLEREHPGQYPLLRAGMVSEGEAEQFARTASNSGTDRGSGRSSPRRTAPNRRHVYGSSIIGHGERG
jgi:hypothetical protein